MPKLIFKRLLIPRFRFPIAFKLIGLTVTLLLAVTLLIAMESSKYFEKEVRQTHERANQIQVNDRATEVESLLQSYVDKIRVIAPLLTMTYPSNELRDQIMNISIHPDRDLVAIEIYQFKDGRPALVRRVQNEEFLLTIGKDERYIEALRQSLAFPLESLFAGNFEVMSSSIKEGLPLLTIGIPFAKDDNGHVTHAALADIRLEKLQKIFATKGAAEIFLVDKIGRVLAHPDDRLALSNADKSESPLVSEALDSRFRSNHLPVFWNPDDSRKYYGVFNRTSFGVTVLGQIPEDIILEPAIQVKRKAFYIGGLVLSFSLFLIFLLSISLTRPIEVLLELTNKVAQGNFNVTAADKVASKDEVNDLAIAFDHMTTGLKALVKTQGAEVAQTLMESDLEILGGTKKYVSVLFSDLRGFTEFSEGHTPEEVVSMLNEYFEVMVTCIEKNHGRVNKFIGDAIMAMWGAPTASKDDEYLATKAALDMRMALEALNDRRIARQQTPIKIGIGIHCGEAVAGTIGSKSRLEYTIIGDAVNQASRIEASTKAFGADLLLSDEVVSRVTDRFIIEFAGSAEVKGKAEPLRLYRVRGFFDQSGAPVIVKTPYSDFAAESADKVKVA